MVSSIFLNSRSPPDGAKDVKKEDMLDFTAVGDG